MTFEETMLSFSDEIVKQEEVGELVGNDGF